MCDGGRSRGMGKWVFSQWGRWGRISVQTFFSLYLEILTEGALTTEIGSLFQYSTTLAENANPLFLRWLAPWSTWKGCPLRPRRVGGKKTRSVSILKVVIRSARIRRRCKEWRPGRCSLSLLWRWQMPVSNLIFEFALNGLANKLKYHVLGAGALRGSFICLSCGFSALSRRRGHIICLDP